MNKSKLLEVLEITQLNLVSSYPATNTLSLDIFHTGIALLSVMKRHINDPPFFLKHLTRYCKHETLVDALQEKLLAAEDDSLHWLYHFIELLSQDVEGQQD